MFLSKLDSFKNASALIDENQKLTGIEEIPLIEAHKRVLAEDIFSYHDSPPFDKSAMDGFALKAEDTFNASQSQPLNLKIVDDVGAGNFTDKIIDHAQAVTIATGAPIPEGADAVLMKEYTVTDGDELTIYSQVTPGENISPKAEDIKKDDKILSKNTFIRYPEIGLIASAGYASVKVYRKPKVKLIVTGNELIEPTKDDLSYSKIINSNKFTIKSMIEDSGATVDISCVGDSFNEVRCEVQKASENYDVIMTTGGTAISDGDVVLDVVEDLGKILFHGVAVRPGKPFGAGIINDKMIFTFSGQPVAAMSQFDVFAKRFLFKMQGREFDFSVVKREAELKIPSQLGRTDFIRAFSDDVYARHVLNRGSGIIRSMVEANSYIIIDENNEGYQKGDLIDVVFFDSLLW